MDFNYTLKYRTFDQLLEDVTIDLHTFALENMIEPQQLIKLTRKINYLLGLRINQTKEVILEVTHKHIIVLTIHSFSICPPKFFHFSKVWSINQTHCIIFCFF